MVEISSTWIFPILTAVFKKNIVFNNLNTDNPPCRYLCNTYGESLTEKVFFFVDNRNVIGKDIPFQLIHQRVFGAPMFYKSVVLAHDVDDFSKIWQAMGRSRTMNKTLFAIYKSSISPAVEANCRFVRYTRCQFDSKTNPIF